MSHDVTVHADPESAVVVKRAWGADAVRLKEEGERLRVAAHPGVVEVLESSGADDAWELRLAHGGRPLAAAGRLAPVRVGSLAAALASTVADLHEAGVVHGRIDADHVLLGAQGRPVLCGFGTLAGAPAEPGDRAAEPSDDVAAIGALLGALLDGPPEMEPIPGSHWSRPSRGDGWLRRSLLTIADQAMAEPASRRPSARRLAEALAATVPSSATATPGRRAAGRSRRLVHLGAVALPLAAVAGLVGIVAVRPTSPEAATVSPTTIPGPPSSTAAGSPSARPTSVPGSAVGSPPPSSATTGTADGCAGPPAPPAAGAPDDCPVLPPTTGPASPVSCLSPEREAGGAPRACGEPVSVEGNQIAVGSRTYEAGRAGDDVVLGDWDCDGASTPAVLRPATGEVFVFAGWPTGADLVVPAVQVVEGGKRLRVVASERDGACSALVVVGPQGPLARLEGDELP